MSAQLGDRSELVERIARELGQGGNLRLFLIPVDSKEGSQVVEVRFGLQEGATPDVAQIAELTVQALEAFNGAYEAMGGKGLKLAEPPT